MSDVDGKNAEYNRLLSYGITSFSVIIPNEGNTLVSRDLFETELIILLDLKTRLS